MSFFPDLTPLIKKIEEFTLAQTQTNSLLEEQNQLLKKLLEKK